MQTKCRPISGTLTRTREVVVRAGLSGTITVHKTITYADCSLGGVHMPSGNEDKTMASGSGLSNNAYTHTHIHT